jgi:hypothetical protein
MAGITLAQAEAQLALYLAAEEKALAGQSYEISGRRLTRANLTEIRDGIAVWDARVKELSARVSGTARVRTLVTR